MSAFIRSDNGPEVIALAVRDWITAVGAKTVYIEPGSLWKNGCCESLNARFRDDMPNGEIFYSLREAQILIEQGKKYYTRNVHIMRCGHRPLVPKTIVAMDQRPVTHQLSKRTT